MTAKSKELIQEIAEGMKRVPEGLHGMGFHPWVGRNYNKGLSGKRVLVLGESHYDWDSRNKETDPIDQSLSVWCVAEQVVTDFRSRFYTSVAKAFVGEYPTSKQRGSFWNSVAFYNYVQEIVGMGPRIRPTHEMWKASQPVFLRVLSVLKPDIVFVFGKGMWSELPLEDIAEHEQEVSGHTVSICSYLTKSSTVEAVKMTHPCAPGFSADKYHPVIKDLLDCA